MIEFATVTGALAAVRTISEIAKNINSAELNQKVIDLQNSILELQQQLFEFQTQNLTLKAEKRELLETIEREHQLIFKHEVYWKKLDESYDGPYCPTCWDADHKLIRLGSLGIVNLARLGLTHRYYCYFHRVATFNIQHQEVQEMLQGESGVTRPSLMTPPGI